MAHQVFISYASSDYQVAEKIYHALTAKNIRCWWDRSDIHPGDKWPKELAAAVKEIPSFKESENLDKAIELLKRHDVIAAGKGGFRIASELMRRWVHAKDNRE